MAVGLTRHVVPRVLHRQKTFLLVERLLFVLAAGLGFFVWDLTHNLCAGVLIFLPLYAVAYYVTQRDPQLLQILLLLVRAPHRRLLWFRAEFDPLLHRPVTIRIEP